MKEHSSIHTSFQNLVCLPPCIIFPLQPCPSHTTLSLNVAPTKIATHLYYHSSRNLYLRYLHLNNFMHKLSSPLSSLKIHLHNKAMFIVLVSMNPRSPNSLGLSRASHLIMWYFLFPTYSQKNLTSS